MRTRRSTWQTLSLRRPNRRFTVNQFFGLRISPPSLLFSLRPLGQLPAPVNTTTRVSASSRKLSATCSISSSRWRVQRVGFFQPVAGDNGHAATPFNR